MSFTHFNNNLLSQQQIEDVLFRDHRNCGLRNIRPQFESSVLSIKSLLAELVEFDLAGKVAAH